MTATTIIVWYAAIGYLLAAIRMLRLKRLGLLWEASTSATTTRRRNSLS